MSFRYVRIVAEGREELWTARGDFSRLFGMAGSVPRQGTPYGPLDHLRYLKARRGEKIVALDPATDALVGWIGLFPDRDEGGHFFRLAGIEVHADWRGRGIGSGLLGEAGKYLREHRVSRLRFGTSPLLTQAAGLFVRRFGARYRWKEGVRSPEGRPWPYVTAECDFDDPLPRPLGLRDEDALARAVVSWEGAAPVHRTPPSYTGTLFFVLPSLTADVIAQSSHDVPRFLEILAAAFQDLHLHGYAFAWFDRVPEAAAGARTLWYYAMARLLGL
jgi:GNAT superfamily N-acetyltransferase